MTIKTRTLSAVMGLGVNGSSAYGQENHTCVKCAPRIVECVPDPIQIAGPIHCGTYLVNGLCRTTDKYDDECTNPPPTTYGSHYVDNPTDKTECMDGQYGCL